MPEAYSRAARLAQPSAGQRRMICVREKRLGAPWGEFPWVKTARGMRSLEVRSWKTPRGRVRPGEEIGASQRTAFFGNGRKGPVPNAFGAHEKPSGSALARIGAQHHRPPEWGDFGPRKSGPPSSVRSPKCDDDHRATDTGRRPGTPTGKFAKTVAPLAGPAERLARPAGLEPATP